VRLGLAAAAAATIFEGAGPYAQLLANPTIDASKSRAERLLDVGPEATRETLARAGYPLLSGEGVVRAIGPWPTGRPSTIRRLPKAAALTAWAA
jgi:hypothetical protein